MSDANGTTNLSRREMLSAAQAAVAAIGVGISIVPTLASEKSSEIARLLEIERQVIAHSDAVNVQYAISDKIGRELRRAKAKMFVPEKYFANDPAGVRSKYAFNQSAKRYRARVARMKEESGFNASEAKLAELRERRDDLQLAVWKTKATSLEALKIKARIAKATPFASASVIQDLLDI